MSKCVKKIKMIIDYLVKTRSNYRFSRKEKDRSIF